MPQAHLVINLKITIISHARLSEDFSTDGFPDNEKQNKSNLKIKVCRYRITIYKFYQNSQ